MTGSHSSYTACLYCGCSPEERWAPLDKYSQSTHMQLADSTLRNMSTDLLISKDDLKLMDAVGQGEFIGHLHAINVVYCIFAGHHPTFHVCRRVWCCVQGSLCEENPGIQRVHS